MSERMRTRRLDEARCYETDIDDERAGRCYFRERDGVIEFTHTEVGDAFGGRGVGGALVRFALDDAISRGLRIVPSCPFVAAYIERHPEYEEHVEAR